MASVDAFQVSSEMPIEQLAPRIVPAKPHPVGFHRHRDLMPIPDHLRGSVVAIGNFDGLHRGHQIVLDCACAVARLRGVPAVVLTFEPHPRTVFRPADPVARLSPAPQRAEFLRQLCVDGVVEYPFDRNFAQRTPDEFVGSVLAEWLGASEVVVGHDFHFGKARAGTPEFLKDAGREYGFGVALVEPHYDSASQIVSSTRIREYLARGDVASAAVQLGYRYTTEATFIGQPSAQARTALARLPSGTPIAPGSYSIRLRLEDGRRANGIARVGLLGAVSGDKHLVEIRTLEDGPITLSQVRALSFFDQIATGTNDQTLRKFFKNVQPLGALDRVISFPVPAVSAPRPLARPSRN